MGNTIIKENNNWNSLQNNIAKENSLSNDSKLLISKLKLNLPELSDSSSGNIDDIFSRTNKRQTGGGNDGSDLSDTSPFISSTMYNVLMNNNKAKNLEMVGGAAMNDDDSSTSSTSSSGDKKGKKKKNNYKAKKTVNESDKDNNFSYVSSSAHTEGNESGNSVGRNTKSNETTQSEVKASNKKLRQDSDKKTKDSDKETKDSEAEPDSEADSEADSEPDSDANSEAVSEPESAQEETTEQVTEETQKPPKRNTRNKKQKGGLNDYESSSEVLSSIVNENSNLPPSSIRTSDINMVTE
jgi:hypothetical protein